MVPASVPRAVLAAASRPLVIPSPLAETALARSPSAQLGRFLAAMKANKRYADYALTVTLAFTGLRFCHASALKWEDIDFEAGVIRGRQAAGAWCPKEIGMTERFTVHGLRRTFSDLMRRAGARGDRHARAPSHVTEGMTAHYSTVGFGEKQAAVAGGLSLGSRRTTFPVLSVTSPGTMSAFSMP